MNSNRVRVESGARPTASTGRFLLLATAALLLVGMLAAGCAGPGSAVAVGIGEGNRAPDFQLQSLDGQDVSLDDYRGKVVLLNFWATWCGPCREEVPALEAAFRARQDDDFAVLGVNFQESAADVQAFVDAFDVTYPILLDENGQVMKTYRAVGLPVSLLIDRDGVIQVRHTGLLTGTVLDEYLSRVMPETGK